MHEKSRSGFNEFCRRVAVSDDETLAKELLLLCHLMMGCVERGFLRQNSQNPKKPHPSDRQYFVLSGTKLKKLGGYLPEVLVLVCSATETDLRVMNVIRERDVGVTLKWYTDNVKDLGRDGLWVSEEAMRYPISSPAPALTPSTSAGIAASYARGPSQSDMPAALLN